MSANRPIGALIRYGTRLAFHPAACVATGATFEFMFHAAHAPRKLAYARLANQKYDHAWADLLFSQRVLAWCSGGVEAVADVEAKARQIQCRSEICLAFELSKQSLIVARGGEDCSAAEFAIVWVFSVLRLMIEFTVSTKNVRCPIPHLLPKADLVQARFDQVAAVWAHSNGSS
jgi:hypothetical protein